MKKVFAGISASAMFVSQMGVAIAAYSDVPSGIWYEDAVDAFLSQGILDDSQPRFRGGDLANRAEFVKLVVELNGGILSTPPATPSFDDVAPGQWYYGYFEEAGREGWVRGDGSCYGTHPCYARPGSNINRAEAAAIIVRSFGLDNVGDAPQFVDNPSGQWYTEVIQTAADHCVLQGDDSTGRVRPADNMNRAEMVVMLHRVDQALVYGQDCGEIAGEPTVVDAVATASDTVEVEFNVPVDQTAATDVSHYSVTNGSSIAVTSVSMINNDTVELRLGSSTVAGEQYTLTVTDMVAADGTIFSASIVFNGYTAIVIGNGTLEVSASANSPVGDTVPKGAVGVVMNSVDLTATGDDVILENLTVLHEGFGDSADLSGVYGVVNGERVTRKRALDSSTTTATIRFQQPLVIRAGNTVTLDIAADLTSIASTASEHSLTVELPSDFFGNAREVTGNFPIRGGTFRVAAVSSGIMSVTYRSVTPTKVKVGDTNAKVGKFELDIDSTEDQTIYSMTIENDGTTGDGDITNLKIQRSDGTILTNTVAQTVGDFATFVFDPPFTILEGDQVTLDIVADIVDGAAKNVKMAFDESSDIFAVGSLYGYGVNGQLYGSSVSIATTPDASTVTIDAGEFTISIDGPSTQNYTSDDDNAVLANIKMSTAGEDIDVEELYIAVQGTTSTGDSFANGRSAPGTADDITEIMEGVEIYNATNGRVISGVAVSGASSNDATGGTASGAYQIYRFDDFVIRGTETYQFRVDFISNSAALAAPASGDRFRIHICGEPTSVLDSNNALVTNTAGCSFGGLLASAVPTYQMQVRGASTNDRVGDVRPRGEIAGSFHDIRSSGLTITVNPQAATDVSVKNAKDITLMRFEARASEAKDILLTNLIFERNGPSSLTNGNNYTLWVDSNGDGNVDTIVEAGKSNQGGNVTFDNFAGGGWIIPKDTTVVFEVHSDIAASLTTNIGPNPPVLALRFATGSTFVQAEEVDNGSSVSGIQFTHPSGTLTTAIGSCSVNSTCNIDVNLANTTLYTLRNSGDLYVTKSTQPVRERQLLGGTLEESILRLQFHAEYEDIDVRDLVFTSMGGNQASFSTNVQRLELYKAGSNTSFANATVGDCKTGTPSNSMCASMQNQQLIIPKGEDLDIIVRPRLNTDTNGATRGHVVQLYVDRTPTNSDSGTGAVRARGLQSSIDLLLNDADGTPEGEVFIGTSSATANTNIEGNVNQVVLAKVTSITNASPDADGTAISSGNDRAIGQFKFAAASHNNQRDGSNDWVLSGVIFNVNATNVLLGAGDQTSSGTSDFMLYNKADPTTKQTCTADKATASGALLVTCVGLVAATVNTAIDAGTDATFVLEADITNPKVLSTSTSTLQVSLSSFTTRSNTNFGTNTNIAWVDDDNGTDVQFKWVDYPETSISSTSYRN